MMKIVLAAGYKGYVGIGTRGQAERAGRIKARRSSRSRPGGTGEGLSDAHWSATMRGSQAPGPGAGLAASCQPRPALHRTPARPADGGPDKAVTASGWKIGKSFHRDAAIDVLRPLGTPQGSVGGSNSRLHRRERHVQGFKLDEPWTRSQQEAHREDAGRVAVSAGRRPSRAHLLPERSWVPGHVPAPGGRGCTSPSRTPGRLFLQGLGRGIHRRTINTRCRQARTQCPGRRTNSLMRTGPPGSGASMTTVLCVSAAGAVVFIPGRTNDGPARHHERANDRDKNWPSSTRVPPGPTSVGK